MLKDQFEEITLMDNSIEMIKVCKEKATYFNAGNIIPVFFDLEQNNIESKFDIIYNQMVLHHVNDVESILTKFYTLLNPGGYLAIADLYPEDGSFHGPEVKVHLGFDPSMLTNIIKHKGFKDIQYKSCFEIKRESGENYPVFLLVAKK
jgi:2-polyprenyl-3-methyl-5-hydroxy-6-metoxy-1,4-benzoquinol methylase